MTSLLKTLHLKLDNLTETYFFKQITSTELEMLFLTFSDRSWTQTNKNEQACQLTIKTKWFNKYFNFEIKN